MSAILTITIDSADYVALDRILRVKQAECVPGASEHVCAILWARQHLGLSTHPRDKFSDYVEGTLDFIIPPESEP